MNAAARPLDLLMARKLGVPSGRLSPADLKSWQLERLRATLRHARTNSAFYRQRLAMLDENAIETLADIARLPFTTADDLATDPLRFLCVSQSRINRIVSLDTSGTTGNPKRLFFTEADQRVTLDFFRDGLQIMAGAGDRILILLPGEVEGSVGELLHRAIGEFGGHPILGGLPIDSAASAALVQDSAPDLIIGIPVQVLAVARHWRERGGTGTVRSVLLCSDNVPSAIAREIRDIWGSDVFEDWGMTEMGYGGGVDCPAHDGYHLQEADFLFEIVDPVTGAPLPEGEAGEIVFTTLTREGMPLIRYRTGDISRFRPETCACGSALRRLDRIESRKTGLIALGDRTVSMAALDDALFALGGVNDYTARLGSDDPVRTLRVAIFPVSGSDWNSLRGMVGAALYEQAAIAEAVAGGTLRLEIEKLDRAPQITRQKRTIKREHAS